MATTDTVVTKGERCANYLQMQRNQVDKNQRSVLTGQLSTMGKATRRVSLQLLLLLLLSKGGVCGETKEGGPDRSPAPAAPDGARTTAPETHGLAPTPGSITTPEASAAPPGRPTGLGDFIIAIMVVVIFLLVLAYYACCKKLPNQDTTVYYYEDRHAPPRPALPSSLRREEREALEDALSTQGSAHPGGPVVKFRRAKPGKPNDNVAAPPPPPPPADVLLFQDLA